MPPTQEQRERGRSYGQEWREHRPRRSASVRSWTWKAKAEPEEPKITVFARPQKVRASPELEGRAVEMPSTRPDKRQVP
eukprot:4345493-Alexandrium_andersonii.AAC.1